MGGKFCEFDNVGLEINKKETGVNILQTLLHLMWGIFVCRSYIFSMFDTLFHVLCLRCFLSCYQLCIAPPRCTDVGPVCPV